MLQKVEATNEIANINLYYLEQLDQQLQLCIGNVTCMDNFLTVLDPTKNNTNTINLESKIYNTDNVPLELPFP
ncbi:MAG: hypothetical protein WA667_01250 [Candidatus Nitrosopolaris sp.]